MSGERAQGKRGTWTMLKVLMKRAKIKTGLGDVC